MKEGDILGLENGKLEIIDKDPVHAATRLARSMAKKEPSFITPLFTAKMCLKQKRKMLSNALNPK